MSSLSRHTPPWSPNPDSRPRGALIQDTISRWYTRLFLSHRTRGALFMTAAALAHTRVLVDFVFCIFPSPLHAQRPPGFLYTLNPQARVRSYIPSSLYQSTVPRTPAPNTRTRRAKKYSITEITGKTHVNQSSNIKLLTRAWTLPVFLHPFSFY
jgi:hypothetical protein